MLNKDVPNWARYHAFDKDGEGWFFTKKPKLVIEAWQTEDGAAEPSGLQACSVFKWADSCSELDASHMCYLPEHEARINAIENIALTRPNWALYHAYDCRGNGWYYSTRPDFVLNGNWAHSDQTEAICRKVRSDFTIDSGDDWKESRTRLLTTKRMRS